MTLATLIGTASSWSLAQAAQEDLPPRTDYIASAMGAWLVSISFSGAEKGPTRSQAFQTYDGLNTPRAMLSNADHGARLELVYELPALTTFDRLAVPSVLEVPSAYVTFFQEVEVSGSADSPVENFELLAGGVLEIHRRRNQVTELEIGCPEASPIPQAGAP